jgi:DHA3 family macrolide efflux protein-like MFS transporter
MTGQTERAVSMRRFLTIWVGQAFSLFGSQLVQFALVWWLTERTGSATVLAVASLMGLLPQVLISPVAGALVDRWSRRRVMIVADSAIALATATLAALFALDAVAVWQVYALMLVRGVGAAFHWPAMQASTSLMVPEEHLARVAGLNQALQGAANIIAPPLGALLLGLLPMGGILAIDVATALMAVGPLLLIAVPQPARTSSAEEGAAGVLADMRAGLRFVWGWAGMRWMLGLVMGLNMLLTPATSLTPLLVTGTFGGGAIHLAALESAMGIGMVAGGVILGVWGGFRRRAMTMMCGLVVLGVGTLGVGLAPAGWFPLAVGGMLLMGAMLPIVNGSAFALVQTVVPAGMQGRVLTLMMSLSMVVAPLGLAAAGPLADVVGVQTWYLAAGALMVCVAAVGLSVPDVVHMEKRGEAYVAGLRP